MKRPTRRPTKFAKKGTTAALNLEARPTPAGVQSESGREVRSFTQEHWETRFCRELSKMFKN